MSQNLKVKEKKNYGQKIQTKTIIFKKKIQVKTFKESTQKHFQSWSSIYKYMSTLSSYNFKTTKN